MREIRLPQSAKKQRVYSPSRAFPAALLKRYLETRFIPREQLDQLELFQAAIRAMEIFWGTAGIMRNPDSTYWAKRRDKTWRHIKRYLKENP